MKAQFKEKPLDKSTIRELKANVAGLHRQWKTPLLSKLMIGRLIGIWKSWNYLTKKQLVKVLLAWKNLMKRWKRGNHYSQVNYGSEIHLYYGNKIYKKYLPAQKLWEARAIASEAQGLWVAIRKAQRCIGFKWEVECWHPDSLQDLLSAVTTTYTNHGSFTEKPAPKSNPFTKAAVDQRLEEEAAAARDDLFGEETPPEKPIINPFKRSILDRVQEPKETSFDKQKFVEDSINEAYKAADLTGWEINSINRTMENADTSIAIVENKVIFNFKTGKTIKSVISCLPDKDEVFKISNTPGKGWFREHISGVVDNTRKYHSSLMGLIEQELEYVPF